MSYEKSSYKSKNITDLQFLSYETKGSFKKYVESKIDFMGPDWEYVFLHMAKSGIEQHQIGFFVGAKISRDVITMRGDFSFHVWKEKHGEKIGKFSIKKRSGRIKLPKASKDDDCLSFTINSVPSDDFWENNFIPQNSCFDEDNEEC